MKPSKVKKLLKKKRWKGEEVGKLLIANTLNDIAHQVKGEEYEPFFNQDKHREMTNTFKSEKEWAAYNIYAEIFNLIMGLFPYAHAQYYRFMYGYFNYRDYVKEALLYDAEETRECERPLTMTQEQYTRERAATEKALMETQESFYSIFFSLIGRYYAAVESPFFTAAPEPVKRELEALREKPAKGLSMCSFYTAFSGISFLIGEDESAPADTDLIVERTGIARLYDAENIIDQLKGEPAYYPLSVKFECCKLFYKGAAAIRAAYKEKTGQELPEIPDKELLDAFEYLITGYTDYNPYMLQLLPILGAPVKERGQRPELSALDLVGLFSTAAIREDNTKEQRALLKQFEKDYKGLYNAMEDYLTERIHGARTLTPNQYYKPLISWKELKAAGIFDSKIFEATDKDILKRLGKRGSGIAIIQNPTPGQIDKNGDYRPEQITPLRVTNLEGIEEDPEDVAFYREKIIEQTLTYTHVYNTLLDTLAEIYDIEDIEQAKTKTGIEEGLIAQVNRMIYALYLQANGEEAERKHKRKIIKECIPAIDTKSHQAKPEAVEMMKAALIKVGTDEKAREILRDRHGLIDFLTKGRG